MVAATDALPTDFSPELRLLLLTCTVELSAERKSRITNLVSSQPIEWTRLDRLANRHRLKPFLYRALRLISATPESVLASLKQDCQLTATDNLLKLHEYRQLRDLLTTNSIAHMPLKGVYLAENCYPDTGLRISGDIDLLVSKHDVVRTIQLLQQQHYALGPQYQIHLQRGEATLLADLFEVSLFKPFFNNSRFDVDLHWHIMGFNQKYVLFDLAYAQSEAAFLREREIVLLVTHHGINNIWQQLYYINDLYFLLSRSSLDWSWLLSELARYGFDSVFLAGVYWCQQIWTLPLPAFVQAQVNTTRVRSLARAYADQWEANQPAELSHLIRKQLLLLSKSQTTRSEHLKTYKTFLTSRIFRYSLFKLGNRLVYIPKEAGFITFFIRMTQSAVRLLRTRPS